MTGKWQIEPNNQAGVFARMTPESSLAGVFMTKYFFTVPKGVANFKIKLTGVHTGKFGALLFNQENHLVEQIDGNNPGECRLPWLKYDRKRTYQETVPGKITRPCAKN